jgi:hypothetical protein
MEVGAMPKEITYGTDQTVIETGWTRNLPGVQVGTVNPEAGGIHDPSAGWFVSLDRQGVNRLIRTLRKARDQAFGPDA